jgi:hypothetical protein
MQQQRLPHPLAGLGLLVGVVGIAGTLVPAAGTATIVLLLVWTLGFATVLLRQAPAQGLL